MVLADSDGGGLMRTLKNLLRLWSSVVADILSLRISVNRCLAFLLEKIYSTEVQSIDDLANSAGMVPANGGTPFSLTKALYMDTSLYGQRLGEDELFDS